MAARLHHVLAMTLMNSFGAASLASFLALAACAAPVGSGEASVDSLDNGRAPEAKIQKARGEVQMVSVQERTPSVEVAAVCEEPGRYDVRADVVVDTANGGRLWQRAADPALRSQPEAIAYCDSLVLGGEAGWRLPIVQELQTLRLKPSGLEGGPQYCMPSIDQTAFPSTPAAEFWSATVRDAGDGLYTEFDDGRTHPSDLATPMYVRCVHDASSQI